MFRLDGKTAIVTGAAHGIGRAIAETYARAGASVLVTDIDAEAGGKVTEGIHDRKGRGHFLLADAASQSRAQEAVSVAEEVFGSKVRILCNNAAFMGPFHAAAESSDEEWERGFQVTLKGAQNYIQAVLPQMIEQRDGVIINISSIQGLVGCPDSASYTSFKAGLLGLTRSVAYDYGPHNIRANALCPGPIQTRISPKPGEDMYQYQVNNTMLRRVGHVEDIACAALYLASDEASFVTGIQLPVDGGWTAI